MQVSDSPSRRLGLHHIAFFRSHLEGLDLATLGQRYLESGADLPKAKATLRWVRDQLIAAARKEKPAFVKLLSIPIGRLDELEADGRSQGTTASPAKQAPSLAEFQETYDSEGFFDEDELIKRFQEMYPVSDPTIARRIRRNARLRQRMRDAILWLEPRVAAPPKAGDAVLAWFDEALARRLMAANLNTLGDLQGHIARRGKHWYRHIPRIGPVAAARLSHWLDLQGWKDSPPPIQPLKTIPGMPTAEVITIEQSVVPLERVVVPRDLSGAVGSNRSYGSKLQATDDLTAIQAWLASLGPRTHTVRSYRTQAERFLLWMILERQKPLSSATTEDCISYRDFLNALDGQQLWYWRLPREIWIGARSRPRWSSEWRPFAGGLSPSSQKLAITILTAMCEWLMRQRYLETNPWDGVPPAQHFVAKLRVDHSLTREQWQTLIRACDDMPLDEAYFRLRFTVLLAYGTGLRLSELAAAKVAPRSMRPGQLATGLKPAAGADGWELVVIGKGNKPRSVPLPEQVMETMTEYFDRRGLGCDPTEWPEQTPLIATLGEGLQFAQPQRQPISHSALGRMLQGHFKRTARLMESALDAGHLLQASTHWLRHTHATHALEAGAEIREVQENLGHASSATTAIYTHTSKKRRKAAVEKLMSWSKDKRE